MVSVDFSLNQFIDIYEHFLDMDWNAWNVRRPTVFGGLGSATLLPWLTFSCHPRQLAMQTGQLAKAMERGTRFGAARKSLHPIRVSDCGSTGAYSETIRIQGLNDRAIFSTDCPDDLYQSTGCLHHVYVCRFLHAPGGPESHEEVLEEEATGPPTGFEDDNRTPKIRVPPCRRPACQ